MYTCVLSVTKHNRYGAERFYTGTLEDIRAQLIEEFSRWHTYQPEDFADQWEAVYPTDVSELDEGEVPPTPRKLTPELLKELAVALLDAPTGHATISAGRADISIPACTPERELPPLKAAITQDWLILALTTDCGALWLNINTTYAHGLARLLEAAAGGRRHQAIALRHCESGEDPGDRILVTADTFDQLCSLGFSSGTHISCAITFEIGCDDALTLATAIRDVMGEQTATN
ncbi:hypothetical protein C1Y63_04890 [Corynebacterium sp. 13CS0277]|uniref:hypothetical protein n=1 Tax=Corynebacterium sp. 13CS0277 TaxID=2071994 RepID=UPI000D02AD43|nr:hypothetical protein [Corynebacterium sp. 13CS0277]PRQ11748.1 hypothetical protein C1Y63_04890 [Corynebacterium sp. 13CS0277]